MAWTDKQKQIAIRACKAAGITDEQRKLILRQFPNSLYDRHGKPTGEPSSTSARLDNGDFEQVMAIVEGCTSGGKLQLRRADGTVAKDFSRGYWQEKAHDESQRLRHLVRRIASTLELSAAGSNEPLLQPNGVGLAGWIRQRVTGGRTNSLDDLTTAELHMLINGLKVYARRHGVRLSDEPQPRATLAR